MSSFEKLTPVGSETSSAPDEFADYIPMILRVKKNRSVGLRELALSTRIARSRLGLLLHSDPAKRTAMLFVELRAILKALRVDFYLAIIVVETLRDLELLQDSRFETAQILLSRIFSGLPPLLLAELDKISGLDGTEVRSEWAEPLSEALVEKLVKEVAHVISRRAAISLRNEQGY